MTANKILKHIEKYNNELLKIIDDTYDIYQNKIRVDDIYNFVAFKNRLLVLDSVYDSSKKLEDKIRKELKEGKCMKVIDLLNKIANGEKPTIKDGINKYEYNEIENDYITGMGYNYEHYFSNISRMYFFFFSIYQNSTIIMFII